MKSLKVTRFSLVVVILCLLALTVATRFYALTNKPIHFDESINGWFVMQMHRLGFYKYDPTNYHGPLYFYLLQYFETWLGRSLQTLRTVPAFFSVLSVMIFSLPILRARKTSWWMAAFVLLSPAFIFFGRSGIHESTFVFFQLLTALGMLRWLELQDSKAWGFFLVGLFGMLMLKETFTVTLFSGFVAMLSLGGKRLKEIFAPAKLAAAWNRSLTLLMIVLVMTFILIFSGFLRHPQGLLDFGRAFLPWLKTGVHGIGHNKPFFYWLQVMWTAEPVVLIGVALSLVGVFSARVEWRFVSVFSLVQLLVYSLIPYKTVWCILTLVWGFYFSLAYALTTLHSRRWKMVIGSLMIGAFAVSAESLYRSVYAARLDFDHPYIYVNGSYEFREMQDFLLAKAQENPTLLTLPIQVGMGEQWPLPWVFRNFNIASYQHCGKTVHFDSMVYFCDPEDRLTIERTLTEAYWRVPIYIREDRGISYAYFKVALFPEVPFKDATIVGEDDL